MSGCHDVSFCSISALIGFLVRFPDDLLALWPEETIKQCAPLCTVTQRR
jgi:hypothetical protein